MAPLNLTFRSRLPDQPGLAPAVVMVHGWLGNEDVMWAFESTLPAGAAVFSPRAPLPVQSGYGWMLPEDPGSFQRGLDALREFVTGLPAAYPVDPARLVLMGFSQGAAMAGALLLAAPELARGAAMLAGLLPEPAVAWAAPGRLAGRRLLILHGEHDETIPVDAARRARAVLTAAGAAVTYAEYPVGHKLSAQGMRALRAWLAEAL
ncbi:MAG: dienelactone hydrolase family protein [Anaerolineales bacterium]|nr:dienelactone hydrolase family protein [Anaerolineales bacterium]